QYGRFVINPDFFSPPEVGDPFDPQSLALVQHEGYIFSEGLAAVYTVDRNWAYIDTTGQVVIQGDNILSARRFREGLANVYKDRRWGYINKQAEWVIEPQFLYPVEFQNGLAVVMNDDRELLVLRKDGTRILPQYRIETAFFNGVATVRERFKGQAIDEFDNRKYGLVDTSGRIMFRPQFDAVGRFGSGMVPILVGSKIGDPLVHPKPPQPTEVPGGKWGYADPTGRIIINPVYEGTQGFSEGIGAIKRGGLWALIEPDGSRLTDHEFRWVDYFKDGIAAVRLGPTHSDYDGRYAYIDRYGQVIWIEPAIDGLW
ncbi:MAG: WG repeat-containing protein, partial [Bacteroidota bacterium]